MLNVLQRWRAWGQRRRARDIGDAAQLRNVRQMLGPLIRRPQTIEHYMYVSSEERARTVVAALWNAGYGAAISRQESDGPSRVTAYVF